MISRDLKAYPVEVIFSGVFSGNYLPDTKKPFSNKDLELLQIIQENRKRTFYKIYRNTL